MDILVLENEKFIVKVLTLGATLNSFYVKNIDTDVVLGFDDLNMYLDKRSASMGKTIGRCANRIGGAKFSLNNVEYKLLANNGPNTLHGGEVRFGDKEWAVKEKTDKKVVLIYESEDMESGFPGCLKVSTTYELDNDNLIINFKGISDKDTIFNLTNHAYFNLDKNKTDILNHKLKIPAGCVNLNDLDGMATDKVIDVRGTPFDFLDYKEIKENVSANGESLNEFCEKIIKGEIILNDGTKKLIDNLDTNYLYENFDEKVICELKNDIIKLIISSDLPSVQIYTGKSLGVDGRDGHYGMYSGIAIEPQFCPNAINYEKFLKPILKANTLVSHTIKYKIINL